jgi:hypothetical protein
VKTSITYLIVLVVAITAHARIINVPADYPTIQAGIDASVNGDTVLVAPGTYAETFNMQGKNILLTSSQGPDTTVIQGHLWVNAGEDSTCIIRGFTFFDPWQAPYSYINAVYGASPIIEGNIFRNGFTGAGGAMSIFGGSNPKIRENVIKNNYSRYWGGGLFFAPESDIATRHAQVSNNIISGNRAGFTPEPGGSGAGIYLVGDADIRNNLIYNNRGASSIYPEAGGGIYKSGYFQVSQGFKTIIANNTIANNEEKFTQYPDDTHGIGGGIYISAPSALDSLVIKNNIIAFNYWGGNVRGYPNDSMYFEWDYNLIYGDTSLAFQHGEHDIFQDPLFIDTASHDYHLLPNSPCIDAGDPNSPVDPDGTRADIGAYFFDHSVDISNPSEPIEPFSFQLFQNYPTPFNSNTIISYKLNEEGNVNLQIYSVGGQLIRNLINNEKQASGEHRVIWDAKGRDRREVTTGLYIYRLSVNGRSVSRAMITIR